MLYLDKGDAIGGHGDVVAQLVEELRRNPQGGAAKLELVRPVTETRVYEHHSTSFTFPSTTLLSQSVLDELLQHLHFTVTEHENSKDTTFCCLSHQVTIYFIISRP